MKKSFLLGLAAIMTTVSLAGCGGEAVVRDAEVKDVQFPLEQPIELRWWQPMSRNMASAITNIGDMAFVAEMEKETGIKIKYESPAVGEDKTQFNLLLASKDLPDIVYYQWIGQSQTPGKFLDDGIIQNLTPYMETLAPNLMEILAQDDLTRKEVTDEDGNYFMFPFLRLSKNLRASRGFMIRQDWLDKLGLPMPSNSEQLYETLVAFKSMGDDIIPLTSQKSSGNSFSLALENLMAMFRANKDFILSPTGEVVYGPTQPEFKQSLEYFNKLYTEGLLDVDYPLNDDQNIDAKFTSGKVGINFGLSSTVARYSEAMLSTDPTVKVRPMPQPEAADGIRYTNYRLLVNANNGYGAAVTRDNKYPSESTKLLDFGYGEKGKMFIAFGVEGVSYNMVNGEPRLSDEILMPSDNITSSEAILKFAFGANDSPTVSDPRIGEQMAEYSPGNIPTAQTWMDGVDTSYLLPTMSYTMEENRKKSAVINDIQTYRNEMMDKFIRGVEPLSNFDSFVSRLKDMGVDDLVKIEADAYERFKNK